MKTQKPTHYICFETMTLKAFADLPKTTKQKQQRIAVSYELRIVIDGYVEYKPLSENLEDIAKEYKNSHDTEKYITIVKVRQEQIIEEFELNETLPNKAMEAKKQAFISLLKTEMTYSDFVNVYGNLWDDPSENIERIQDMEAEYPEFTKRYDDMCENAEVLCITDTVFIR